MPGQFSTGPNGKLTPKPGTTLNGKRSPSSDADQFSRNRNNNNVPLSSSSKYGGHMSIQEARSTQEIKRSRGAGQIIKFPMNREDMYPAHIIFHPYKIDTGLIDGALSSIFNNPLVADYSESKNSESVNDDITATEDNLGAMGAADPFNPTKKKEVVVEKNAQTQDRDAINKEIKENQAQMGSKLTDLRAYRDTRRPSIQLYFPPTLQYNDAVNYNSANLGAGGATALGALNSGQSIGSALGKGISEGMESIFNLTKGTLSQEAAKVAASRISSKLPAGYAAAGASALQTGLNPGTRLLFDQPTMRSFSFSFKLIPTSSQEAARIREIIENLRFQLYPREIDLNPGIPIGYEFPNIFRIEFAFTGGTLQIPKIQYCYLKDVQAAYNATSGGVFYEDGYPTEVDLNLTFLEYRALSKRDIEAGF